LNSLHRERFHLINTCLVSASKTSHAIYFHPRATRKSHFVRSERGGRVELVKNFRQSLGSSLSGNCGWKLVWGNEERFHGPVLWPCCSELLPLTSIVLEGCQCGFSSPTNETVGSFESHCNRCANSPPSKSYMSGLYPSSSIHDCNDWPTPSREMRFAVEIRTREASIQ
jgi:hypothetical protein